jgi:hypothetical protein
LQTMSVPDRHCVMGIGWPSIRILGPRELGYGSELLLVPCDGAQSARTYPRILPLGFYTSPAGEADANRERLYL